MWAFNNIFEELGGVEGSKSYINVKLWRSCIRLMKAFLNTTNVYGLTLCFVKCECVRTSGTKFARCLWLAYVNKPEVLECGVQAIYVINIYSMYNIYTK